MRRFSDNVIVIRNEGNSRMMRTMVTLLVMGILSVFISWSTKRTVKLNANGKIFRGELDAVRVAKPEHQFDLSAITTALVDIPGSNLNSSATTTASTAVVSRTAHPAYRLLKERRDAYAAVNRSFIWQRKGMGYLYTRHNLLLEGRLVRPQHEPVPAGPTTVRIDTVSEESVVRSDCHLLTLWVRVHGPEIFAGRALPVQPADSTCYWEFTFDLQQPGDYCFDLKMLLWNGIAPTNKSKTLGVQCEMYPGLPDANITQQYPRHTGLKGFHLFTPQASCCEICTREPHCQYWATPSYEISNLSYVSAYNNGCELFFGNDVPEEEMFQSFSITQLKEKKVAAEAAAKAAVSAPSAEADAKAANAAEAAARIPVAHGRPHGNPTTYFMGCGWSFWFWYDFACLSGELDDSVYIAQPNFTLAINDASSVQEHSAGSTLPLCQLDALRLHHKGRWVRKPWPNSTECPDEMTQDLNISEFPVMQHDGRYPHCWHRDDLFLAHSKCNTCRLTMNNFQWHSALQHDRTWYGVWRYYDCDFHDFTDEQLQSCINLRKLQAIELRGMSTSRHLSYYFGQRSRYLNFTPPDANDTVSVIVDTLAAPHIAWHANEHDWVAGFTAMPPVPNNTEHYIVNPFYWSSELQPFVHAGTSERMVVLMERLLPPKGYKVINAHELTKAFTFDTSTKGDGLHIVGPNEKMIVTMVFHDLCSSMLKGSVV